MRHASDGRLFDGLDAIDMTCADQAAAMLEVAFAFVVTDHGDHQIVRGVEFQKTAAGTRPRRSPSRKSCRCRTF